MAAQESSERERVTQSVCENLLQEIRGGDLDHGVSIADMLLSEGPDFAPGILVMLAESVVELAAQAGSSDARSYLEEMWPTLRGAHLRRLERKKQKSRPSHRS